ncbi:response regulator transcription factor [Chamaesiphon polymorphus]|uniref:Two-component system response regulator n=1 Tax=Chamaesiphon polymorphus CCALA 037 TaxID=2107692 RepID=A0A2T1GAV9_9CYAN|nr:response regulator [Chamaesiphon polymorphus]NJR32718.1 response regulator [Chamaesiphon sp. CSU_1_12]PSB54421.1 two-component system response regulator [Chamaesiphon polymorphus CCALA 037]
MRKILIVEDSQSERDLVMLYLKNNNYQVISTDNAEDGMELAANQKPDAIVTDITMEGINGFEFCRLLKAYPDTSQIPIIACTARDRDLDRFWGQKQGIDVYITKPYSEQELITAIESVVK